MKHKVVILSVSGIFALILLALSIPLILGTVIQSRLNSVIDSINNQNLAYTFAITDYQRGWFTSEAKIQVASEFNNIAPTPLSIKIYHGPIIVYDNHLHLAYGDYSSNFAIADLHGKFKGWVGFTNHLYGSLHIKPITVKSFSNSIELGNIDVHYFIPLNSLQNYHFDVSLQHVNFQLQAISGDLNDIHFNLAAEQQSSFDWNWDTSLALGTSKVSMQNPNNKNTDLLNIQSLLFKHFTFNSAEITQLLSLIESGDLSAITQQIQIVSNNIINQHTQVAINNLSGDFSMVKFLLNINVSWPNLPKHHSFKELLANENLDMYILVPELNYQDDDNNFSLLAKNFSLQEVYSKSKGMNATIKLDNAKFSSKQTFELQNLKWFMISDKNAVHNNWQINTQKLCLFDDCFNNLTIKATANNINSDAAPASIYDDWTLALEQFDKDNNFASFQSYLQKDIAPQINAHSLIQFTLNTETMHGPLSIDTSLAWPDFTGKNDVFNTTEWQLASAIPIYYIDLILQSINNPGQVAYPNPLGLNLNSQIANIIQQWLKNGYVVHNTDKYNLQLSLKNGQVYFYNKPLDELNTGYLAFNLAWYPLSMQHFLTAAKQGDRYAQFYVGLQYALGLGVEKDNQAAITWLQQSAKQNYSNAALILGGLYYKGSQLPFDYQLALKWFKIAANQHDPRAQTALGTLYANGATKPIIAPDYQQAAYWYQLASQQNYAPAQYRLGQLYESGKGVAQDLHRAYSLYQAAAKQLPAAANAAKAVADEIAQEEKGKW